MKRIFMWIYLIAVSPLICNAIYYVLVGELYFPYWVALLSTIGSYIMLPFFALESKWIVEETFSHR